MTDTRTQGCLGQFFGAMATHCIHQPPNARALTTVIITYYMSTNLTRGSAKSVVRTTNFIRATMELTVYWERQKTNLSETDQYNYNFGKAIMEKGVSGTDM